jgi:hypothetical protein
VDLDALVGKLRAGDENVVRTDCSTQRDDGVVLEQKHCISNRPGDARPKDLLLKGVRLRVRHTA